MALELIFGGIKENTLVIGKFQYFIINFRKNNKMDGLIKKLFNF